MICGSEARQFDFRILKPRCMPDYGFRPEAGMMVRVETVVEARTAIGE